jgi:EmrB/QacA subfamily drug resistance transporter
MSTLANAPCDQGQIQGITAPARSCHRGAFVLAATILGSSMAFIDGTVVNIALPVVQSQFRASGPQVQWVVESYALFLAALLLLGGALGDRLGRRRIFATGVVLFTLASMVCGLAPNISVLIVARAAQGVGGALLTPSSLAIISASFDENERGKAIGTWSGFTAITAAIGPVLGGWLVQNFSWRAVFFLNLPIALVVLFLIKWHIEESYGEHEKGRLDWAGSLLMTAGLAGITYALITWSERSGPGILNIVILAAGAFSLLAFVAVERRVRFPMVPLGLFRSRNFSGANLLTLLLYGALAGALYLVPFNLIQIQHYSPQAAGASLLPFIVVMFLLSRWSGGLVARVGARLPLVAGPLVAAVGFALFARAGIGGSYWTTFGPAAFVLGLGMAIAVAPLTTTVMTSVGGNHAGLASGINNAVSRTAGLLAIALLGILLISVFSRNLEQRLATANLPPEATRAIQGQASRLGGISLPSGLSAEASSAAQSAIGDSFVAGFRAVMIAAAALAVLSAISAAVLIEGGHRKPAGGQERLTSGLSETPG